jgi:hypothetical protein
MPQSIASFVSERGALAFHSFLSLSSNIVEFPSSLDFTPIRLDPKLPQVRVGYSTISLHYWLSASVWCPAGR